MYQVPAEYFRRLHHVRPRFKGNIENVLIFMATRLSELGVLEKKMFRNQMNEEIREFPGNMNITDKTVNNWRTEIISLFGLIISDELNSRAGLRAIELAEEQDLVKFFKTFLFSFQYPGAHVKDKEILSLVNDGIRFQPAKKILEMLKYSKGESGETYLTKAEVTHCIFNDLRVTSEQESIEQTWLRVSENRTLNVNYDTSGDTIRYAGDILDYMEIANLVHSKGTRFYLNKKESKAVDIFLNQSIFFDRYSLLENEESISFDRIKRIRCKWFEFVNRDLSHIDFETDVNSYLSETEEDLISQQKNSIMEFQEVLVGEISAYEIGTRGESIIINHEKTKLVNAGESELIHLVNFIPTQFGVGYDIQSFEEDGSQLRKYIEVKTTISNRSVSFNSFHITKNEWRTAKSLRDRYYIYRMQISQQKRNLFVLKNLYGLVSNQQIQFVKSRDGFDIRFQESRGEYEELIICGN